MTIPAPWTPQEIDALLAAGNIDDLVLIPIVITNLGTPDAAWSESICVTLSSHPDSGVRGNAVLGLGHLARTSGRLTRDVSVRVITAALRDPDAYVRGHAESAARDVGTYLKWCVPPWTDLYARWAEARASGSPSARDLLEAALVRVRDLWPDDLEWFEAALQDRDARWFVAALFRLHPLPKRLFEPMMRSSLLDADASDVQHLIRPCLSSFGSERVIEWLDRAEEVGGGSSSIQKARYWTGRSTRVKPSSSQ